MVSLAGYKKQIAITVHLGLGLPGNQLIGIAILNIGEKSHPLPNYSHLPLAPKSILSWIGFTDQGTVNAIINSFDYRSTDIFNPVFDMVMIILQCFNF